MTPDQLTQELKGVLGDHLGSVILYGSAASGDQTKHYSHIDIMIVLDKTDVDLLEKVSPAIKKWRREGNPTPVFLTGPAIQSSLDVFPIEFMDVKASHRVLYGADPFDSVAVNAGNLRHQLEFELRSKLIQLESRFIETEGKESAIRDLVLRSVSSVTALFKAALRLLGDKPAERKRDVWAALDPRVPVDIQALDEILALRDGRKSTVPVRDLFSRLHASVQRVLQFVDQTH